MNATATQALVTNSLADFGDAVIVILGAVIVLGVGYLVFRFGWAKVKGSLR